MRSIPAVASPTAAASASRSSRHSPFVDPEGDEPGRAADEVDAVDDAGVGGVGDDHLVARVHGDEEGVQEPLHAAAGDDDLALGVVQVPRALGREVGDRHAEREVAGEGEPAVRLRRLQARGRDGDGLGREGEVGVEVLHAEHRPPLARAHRLLGRGRDAVDAEAPDGLEPLRPRDHRASLT